MVGKTGIIHGLHLIVGIEIGGDLLCALTVARHAQLHSLQTAQNEERAEGIHDSARHVLQAEHTHLCAERGIAHHEACDHIAVTVEILGGGMYHHVSAQLQGILQCGGGEGVVADHLDLGVIGVDDLRHGGNIGDLQIGVGRRLQIHAAGVLLQRRLHRLQIGGVDEVHLHAVAGHAVVEKGEGAAVEGGVCHNVLAGTGDSPQCRGDSAHARCGGNAGLAAFQRRHLALQHIGGGVAQTGVDVAALLTCEAAAALLAGVKNEGGGLIDGCSQRTVLLILDISCVNGLCAETCVGIHHG